MLAFRLVIGASLSEPLLVRSTPALSVYIYYHVSYDRHLLRAHAYDLNSKAARTLKFITLKFKGRLVAGPPATASHHEPGAEKRSKGEP